MTSGKRSKRERRARLATQEARERATEDAGKELAKRILTPLAPGDPRLHHYVPKFLLRRFATERERIATISLDDPGRERVASVDNTAAIRDFYSTIADGVGPNVAVEKMLAEVDGPGSAVVEKLTSTEPLPLSDAERDALVLFLAFQKVRGPRNRREFEAMTDWGTKAQLTMDENRRAYEGKPEDAFARYDGVEFAEHQNEAIRAMLDTVEPLATSLRARLVTIVRFGQPGVVLTDEPLVLYQRPGPLRGVVGVGVATADEVWIPLDRSTGLILHSDKSVGERVLEVYGRPEIMYEFNQTIVSSCFNEIYAHPDDVAGLRSLVLPDRNRPLITMSGAVDWVRGRTDGVNQATERRKPRRFDRTAQPTAERPAGS